MAEENKTDKRAFLDEESLSPKHKITSKIRQLGERQARKEVLKRSYARELKLLQKNLDTECKPLDRAIEKLASEVFVLVEENRATLEIDESKRVLSFRSGITISDPLEFTIVPSDTNDPFNIPIKRVKRTIKASKKK